MVLACIACLAASGCTVVGEIEVGRFVSINPCKLVGSKRAEAVMGAPVVERLHVGYSRLGRASFSGCEYLYRDVRQGLHGADQCPPSCWLDIDVADETEKETRAVEFGEFDFKAGAWSAKRLPIKPIDDLGREARYRFWDNPRSKRLGLLVLTTKGVRLFVSISVRQGDERTLLRKARSVVVPALTRMEELSLGAERPPRDVPPAPICSFVRVPALLQIYRSFWTPPPGKTIVLEEGELFGGLSTTGSGPVGGGWTCAADLDPHIYIGHTPEVYHPHVAWWISKVKPSSALPPGARSVPGVGASAYFTKAAWQYGDSVTLSVFTTGGRHFDVEVDVTKIGETVAERTATAIAKEILVKLK